MKSEELKKYIRFFMRNRKHDITLPMDQAERVLDSREQLVKIYDEQNKWTGITINKAEIISTDHDFDKEKDEQWKIMKEFALPAYVAGIKDEPVVDISKFKPDFLKQREKVQP